MCADNDCVTDSVEDGDKVVKTAIDNFGRVGMYMYNMFPPES